MTTPRPSRGRWHRAIRAVLGVALAAATMLGAITTWAVVTMPDPRAVNHSTVVTDRDGRMLRAFLAPGDRWRLPADADRLDADYLAMLLAVEDKRFREHRGVDPLAVARAVWQLAANGRVVSGASTITMQLARLLDPRPRGLFAKIVESTRALAIETRLSKQEILELYLTFAPYGGNLQGVRAASLAYFGKEPTDLTPAEAALLVAIPQAPEARRPDRHPHAARRSRDVILQRLAEIDDARSQRYRAAIADPVPDRRRAMPLSAPHLSLRVAATGSGTVETTIDGALQHRLEAMTALWTQGLEARANLAIVVTQAATGAILAHIGSAGLLDQNRSGHLDLTRAVRSPGSTLKPAIYAMALEDGLIDPRTVVVDAPGRVAGYAPANFDDTYLGETTAMDALRQSLNQPAIALLNRIGPERLIRRMHRAGLDPVLPYGAARPGLAVALGGLGISLEDLVALYGALATDGRVHPLIARPDPTPPHAAPLIEAGPAWEIRHMLAVDNPPGAGHRRVAVKTGTSYGYRDAWAIGITEGSSGKIVVGVWVGRPDGTPRPGRFGRNTAAPLLFDVVSVLGGEPSLADPPPQGWTPSADRPLAPALRFFPPRPLVPAPKTDTFEIASPRDGTTLLLADLDGLTIQAAGGMRPITWLVDGRPIPSPSHRRDVQWRPGGPGFAEILALDAAGNAARARVEITTISGAVDTERSVGPAPRPRRAERD